MKERTTLVLAGLITGIIAVLLVVFGNPPNMGFCIACFLRDITGALGMHRAATVQYIRPEIIGLVLGATGSALAFREFKASGGSGVIIRFFLGAFMMMGALVFLGCPLRMLLRLAGGDLNALVALPGFIFGIWVGVRCLGKGYTLGPAENQPPAAGASFPLATIGLLVLAIASPSFIFLSTEGPGSLKASLPVALVAGLLAGFLAQRTRLCTMGTFRDIILFRDFHLFAGVGALFLAAFIGNLITGKFSPGFTGQPVAHTEALWNFLSMGAVGLAAVLAGGCPLRQLILAGEGNADAAVTVLGMFFGAAFMHNFGWAASPAGVPAGGRVMVVVIWVLLLAIGFAGVHYGLDLMKRPRKERGKERPAAIN
ncbi:MAG TPA: YedE-related selenium metabolism membrane protein [Firmicutes bacterium]|nr:YedE-related selenium metabolism membrane protein [Bacillota bacterium]